MATKDQAKAATNKIAWHPGFASAMQFELKAYRRKLVFETEQRCLNLARFEASLDTLGWHTQDAKM